jgi:carbonic anhydrase
MSVDNTQNQQVVKTPQEEIDELLANNEEYVDYMNQKYPGFFKSLGSTHKPKYLLIGCSDARIQPNALLKLNPGELFIHRNIANQVVQGDMNANAVIQYAIEGLGITKIIVMGHSRCGGVTASMKGVPFSLVDQWITNVKEIYQTHKSILDGIKDEEEKINALAKLNARFQCMNIKRSAAVRRAVASGKKIKVYPFFMNICTGIVENLKMENNYMEKVSEIYTDTLMRLSSEEMANIIQEKRSRSSGVFDEKGEPQDEELKMPDPLEEFSPEKKSFNKLQTKSFGLHMNSRQVKTKDPVTGLYQD